MEGKDSFLSAGGEKIRSVNVIVNQIERDVDRLRTEVTRSQGEKVGCVGGQGEISGASGLKRDGIFNHRTFIKCK